MIDKYFHDKELATKRAERDEEGRKRRLASYIAKGVLNFWSNAKSLVKLKEESKIATLRRKVLDEKLTFIVDQTQKYSNLLTQSLAGTNQDTATCSKASSIKEDDSKANSISNLDSNEALSDGK